MRLSSNVNRSSGERIGFLLLAAFFATLIGSLHTTASKSDAFKGAASSNYPASLPPPMESPTPCCNDKPHLLIGTYYSVKNGLTAKLLLNNKGPDSLTASPSLFSMSGQRFDAPPVTVDGLSYKFIDISTWINFAGLQFQEGSIQVFHYGKDLVLGAQVYLVDENHSLSFDEKLVETKGFKSTQLEGLWWLPSQKGQVLLALSNNSGTAVTATVDAQGNTPHRGGQQTLALPAHETRLLDLQSDVINHANGAMARYGGISITYSGSPGALYARGMAQDLTNGYSLPIQFSDPAAAKSSRLQGVGLRLGFAGGEALTPVAVVRNVGTSNATLTGRVSYTDPAGAINTVPILSLQLSPSEFVNLDLGELFPQHGHEQGDAIGSLELEYSTPKGSVIASALSVGGSGNQVFRVPMWDPAAQRSATGGYPWHVDGNSSTMVYIKNVEQQPQHYYLQLSYGTGIYSLGIRELRAGETVSYDFRKLRDLEVPDVHGRLLPADLSIAQVHWSKAGLETGTLLGRSEQVDAVLGISNNYACVNCCPDNEVNARMVPESATAVVNNNRQFTAQYQLTTCYGQYSDWLEQYDAEWSSTNQGVASVSVGLAQANAPGTATIKADWYADHYVFTNNAPPDPGGIGGFGGESDCEPAPLRDHLHATATFNVFDVRILRDGTDITETTTNVVVGEQINLAMQVLPAGTSASQIQWSVPGTRVANYVANNSTGTVTALGNLQSSTLTFYWADAENGRIGSVSGSVNGEAFVSRAYFNITKPDPATPTVSLPTNGQLNINNLSDCAGNPSAPSMVFGNISGPNGNCVYSGQAGITFSPPTTSTPPGSFFFVQLVTGDTITYGANLTCTATNTPGLDGAYPYQNARGQSVSDAPFNPLPSIYTSSSRNFAATMYLMWQSNTSGSIPVPMGSVNWSFSGSTTQSNGTWSTPTGSGSAQAFVAASGTSSFPTWTGLVGLANGNCH